MTSITIKQEHGMSALRCNGRLVSLEGRITEIRKTGKGRWEGVASGERVEIVGGKESGGAANEWFVKWAPGYDDMYVPAKSAKHALWLVENC